MATFHFIVSVLATSVILAPLGFALVVVGVIGSQETDASIFFAIGPVLRPATLPRSRFSLDSRLVGRRAGGGAVSSPDSNRDLSHHPCGSAFLEVCSSLGRSLILSKRRSASTVLVLGRTSSGAGCGNRWLSGVGFPPDWQPSPALQLALHDAIFILQAGVAEEVRPHPALLGSFSTAIAGVVPDFVTIPNRRADPPTRDGLRTTDIPLSGEQDYREGFREVASGRAALLDWLDHEGADQGGR